MNHTTVLRVNGTGEVEPGLLSLVTRQLDPKRFFSQTVNYAADYGTKLSYYESVEKGYQELHRIASSAPGKVVLLGYSQGATVVGNWIRDNPYNPNILCAGLVADPLRDNAHPAHLLIGDNVGYGVSGKRSVAHTKYPVFQVAYREDPICCLPEGNPLRAVADFTDFMSIRNPIMWARKVGTKIATKQLQNLGDLRNLRLWNEAAVYLRNYTSGKHWGPYAEHHVNILKDRIDKVDKEYRVSSR